MPSKKEFLNTLFQYIEGISPENKDYLLNTLFKYEDNSVINQIIEIVKSHTEANSKFLQVFQDALNAHAKYLGILNPYLTSIFPLITLSPDSNTSLRVYPNIILNSHTNLTNLSTLNVKPINSLLEQYEREIKTPNANIKWNSAEAITAHLNQS